MLLWRIFERERRCYASNLRPKSLSARDLCHMRWLSLSMPFHWLKYKLSYLVMYECTCNTKKSLKVIKITTFNQNQFITCYLIFNFRSTFFSYFRKITAFSISHNVKKQRDQKWSIPVVKGLMKSTNPWSDDLPN